MTPDELRAARKLMGMTQAQFAKALGVSISSLHNWEHGRMRVSGKAIDVPLLVANAVDGLIAECSFPLDGLLERADGC